MTRRHHLPFTMKLLSNGAFRFALLASVVFTLVLIVILRPEVKGNVSPPPNTHLTKPSSPGETATIWSPFWKIGGGFESTLLLNNTQPRPIFLHPLVYTAVGEVLPAMPVSLEKLESKQIALRDIIKIETGEGQVGLSFVGNAMDVVAQVVITNTDRQISFNHVFMAAMGKTAQLEGVCYIPQTSCSVDIALANLSEQPIGARLTASSDVNELVSLSIKLAPHETQTVSALSQRIGQLAISNAVGIRITYTGAPGSLAVQGMVSTRSGYSTSIRLVDPGSLKADRLISPIASLQEASAMVVARNISGTGVAVTAEAHYTLDGHHYKLSLTTHSLAPGESQTFDLTREFRSLPSAASNIALQLISSSKSSVVADLLLLGAGGVTAIQATPKDAEGESGTAYDYPWRVGQSIDTIISLTNPSQSDDLKYSLFIYYGDGKVYSHREHILHPGEARQVTIQELITNQTPDDLGAVLPADAVFGKAKAVVHGVPHKHVELIGEAIIIDAANRVAATLSCVSCAADPNSLAPNQSSSSGIVGDTDDVNWVLYYADSTFIVNPSSLTVPTDDLNVAEFEMGSYRIRFNGPGQTNLHGIAFACVWHNDGETCTCDEEVEFVSAPLSVQVILPELVGVFSTLVPGDDSATIAGQAFILQIQARIPGSNPPAVAARFHNPVTVTFASPPLISGETISTNPVQMSGGIGQTTIVLKVADNAPAATCCRMYGLTSTNAKPGVGTVKIWFPVEMDIERWKNCGFGSCPNLGSYFCTTACSGGLSQQTSFVALPATGVCNKPVRIRNPANGSTQTTTVKDVGPSTNNPYWTTGSIPSTAGCVSDVLADALGVSNGCSPGPFGRASVIWRFD